jgi:hypothetical protein
MCVTTCSLKNTEVSKEGLVFIFEVDEWGTVQDKILR